MNTDKKVAFHTLGCKLNFSETSSIGRMFEEKGYSKVDFKEPADVYVINTCSVTENADKECRQIVKSALKTNPDAFISIIGCYAQLKPQEIASIPGVDLVLGASEKFTLLNYLNDLSKKQKADVYSCDIEDVNDFKTSFSIGDRTRSFLKIQDGCDYTCSFCTIPLARGKSRSGSIQSVVDNAEKIAAAGVKEIVLTGVNIGDFGNGEENFLSLIQELDKLKGIERFRISSIEPNLLTNEIIEFVSQSQRFAPHFHIPLQSGSNTILGLMRRRYKKELYAERIASIKSLIPHCCIGVDVIVGFPSETEENFLETYNFLQKLDISYLHVFTYSERDNTDALNIKDVIPVPERKHRNKMLRILSAKKQHAFYEQYLGTSRPVLFESEKNEGILPAGAQSARRQAGMYGFTDNYIKVRAPYDPQFINQVKIMKLEKFNTEGTIEAALPGPGAVHPDLVSSINY